MRSLSDADVEALAEAMADKMEKRLTDKFYRDVGKGVWGTAWKAFLTIVLVVAAYGAAKGGWSPKL